MNNNNILNTLTQIISLGNNPQQILQNMVSRNPVFANALTQMQSSGLTAQQYVMQYARQNNIDIQPMINLLQQKGFKL